MKKPIKALLCALGAASLFALSSCAEPSTYAGSKLLGKPETPTPLSYAERDSNGLKQITSGAESFAADFSSAAYDKYGDGTNFTVSPMSVYMGLSLAAHCAGGNTKTQLLARLGVTESLLENHFREYFRSVNYEYTYEDKFISCADLNNSIWIDEHFEAKEQCVRELAENFYCHSYSANFLNDNVGANKAIRSFVKDKTRGLIDNDFQIPRTTVFTLINTLYLKDVWNDFGDGLSTTDSAYAFTQGDGAQKSVKLLKGNYFSGRAYETESYKTFFTQTDHGYKLKFIVPQEGYSLDSVFTAENIKYVNSITDYGAENDVEQKRYLTRCFFPEFIASSSANVSDMLKEEFGLSDMFDPLKADFSDISDGNVYCSQVQHVAKLEVNKKGIEGAAVTIIVAAGTGMPGYEPVLYDFVVDRAFGFILTDSYGNTLFSGVVNNV